MSVKTFRLFFEKIIFIFAVTAMTASVVLIMDTIQPTSSFATAPASAAIAIVISCVLSMIEQKLRENPNVEVPGGAEAGEARCSESPGMSVRHRVPPRYRLDKQIGRAKHQQNRQARAILPET